MPPEEKVPSMREQLEQELTTSLKTMLTGKIDQATLDAYVTEVAKEELQKALNNYRFREAIQKIIWATIETEGNKVAQKFLKDPATQKKIKKAAEEAVISGIDQFAKNIEESLSTALD